MTALGSCFWAGARGFNELYSMRYLLASRHLSTLACFASSDVVLAFDYDGTLAPITGNPSRAHMRARTRRLLIAAVERYPCVVISGRGRDDVMTFLRGIRVRHVIGNHGLEPWGRNAVFMRQVRRWRDHLQRTLPSEAGLVVEDKTYSLAIHYRNVQRDRKRVALKAIEDAVVGLRGARIIGGEEVINLVPWNAPHKGMALEQARTLLGCDRAIYVGDDDTDEDVFGAASPERLLSVRVGAKRTSSAGYYLKSQREIDSLLKLLVGLRVAQPART